MDQVAEKYPNECHICFEPLNNNFFKEMKCNHKFHPDCLQTYITSFESNKSVHVCMFCQEPYNWKLLSFDAEIQQKEKQSLKQLVDYQREVACWLCSQSNYSQQSLPATPSVCNHIFHEKCIKTEFDGCQGNHETVRCAACQKTCETTKIVIHFEIIAKIEKLQSQQVKRFQIIVKSLDDQNFVFGVANITKVKHFMLMVEKRTGVETKYHRFTAGMKQITQQHLECQLEDFDIHGGQVLMMLFRVLGGKNQQIKQIQ